VSHVRRQALVLAAFLFAPSPGLAGFPGFEPVAREDADGGAVDGYTSSVPSITALRVPEGAIVVDGRLDDPAWRGAEPASGFRTWEPTRGDPPSEETIFKVVYDDRAIYFGIACMETDVSNIRGHLCRRDNISSSDVVSLYLDTYHDRTTGYNFRVNPRGVQEDGYVYSDDEMDRDWDAVWAAETYIDRDGWYAEIRIPFACVRYRPSEEMTWGCQVQRFMYTRGEDTSWVTWDRETTGFVSRFGEIRSISGIPVPKQLEIMPYVVASATDPAVPGPEELGYFGNVGLDLKYGLAADLTLNATFQPDFGQVEADPALLNLSPFETYYEEKRPFFIEGSRFFEHPDFNLFYSRRIGTGDENSRIRAAAKLTGKTRNGYSLAALYAMTDVAEEGRAHQFWRAGSQLAHYFVGRLGREFSEGAHRVNVMQTLVDRTADRDAWGDYASRDAWTTGVDFDLNFRDRTINVSGSFVGSVIRPAPSASDPESPSEPVYGTGGAFAVRKLGGTFMGGLSGRWESQDLDLSDLGYLRAADEVEASAWLGFLHNSDGGDGPFQKGHAELKVFKSWLYSGGNGYDRDTGELAWSYGPGHPRAFGVNVSSGWRLRNFWSVYAGGGAEMDGTSKYETRTYDAEPGPLMVEPDSFWLWAGCASDSRLPLVFEVEGNYWRNEVGGREYGVGLEGRWTATDAMSYSVEFSYHNSLDDADHLENFENPGHGIGGVSYVFAELERHTIDATLRADILFSRDVSLQLYAQPYVSIGDYRRARELTRPDSYDLEPVSDIPGFDAASVDDYDFRYAAANVNAVLRWEYAPGSTFYLVWKQGRELYNDRASASGFSTALEPLDVLNSEPENVFLAKVTYWFPI